jgi:hypothetical protein
LLAGGLVLLGGAIMSCGSVGVSDHPGDAGAVQDTGNDDAPATTDGGLGGDAGSLDAAPGDAGVKATWDSTKALWDQARWN